MIVYIKKVAAAREHFIKEGGGKNAVVDDQGATFRHKFVWDIVVDQRDVSLFYGQFIAVYVVGTVSLCHIGDFHKIVRMVGSRNVNYTAIDKCGSF